MKADKKFFVQDLFKQNVQYIIPCYQRTYEWKEEKCRTLWDDICVLIERSRNLDGHLMGAIILFDIDASKQNIPTYWLIDGQQRLTTIYVMLKALRDLANEKNKGELVEDIEPLLYNFNNPNDDFLKIRSKNEDEVELNAILSKEVEKTPVRSKLRKAYEFFKKTIKAYVKSEQIEYADVFNAIKKLFLIQEIFFDSDNEDPQVIFEHVNADRIQLSLFDKVRNNLLTGEKYTDAKEWYKAYWKPLEHLFIKTFDGNEVEDKENEYMRNYLEFKGFSDVDDDVIYEEFRMKLQKEISDVEDQKNQDKSQAIITKFSSDQELPINNSQITASDDVRVKYLKQLLYYAYFYVVFVSDKDDTNQLEFGSVPYDFGDRRGTFVHDYHYLWDIRVLLYWFRFLKFNNAYTTFFKLFELEDKNKISQETLKKILLLLLVYNARYFIQNSTTPKNLLSFTSLWPRLSRTFDGNEIKDINDDNCYQLFVNMFVEPVDHNSSYAICKNGDIVESLTDYNRSKWISNTNFIIFMFLVIYYKKIIFAKDDNLLTSVLTPITIFPNLDLDKLKNSSWAQMLDAHEMEYILNQRCGAIGNLTIIDDFSEIRGIRSERKFGVQNFIIPGGTNDLANKQILLNNTQIIKDNQDLYEFILNSQIWGKTQIEKQTDYLANEVVKYLIYDNEKEEK